ncbi:TPA: phage tail protein [Citrobacter farmeri]
MATLPETPQWEDGIYQIEVSDPVLGGPDGLTNRPAKQLASRTLYLKQHVEETGQGLASHIAAADPHSQYAPKNSPVLTGIPTAPTAPQTTNNQQLANTAFVKAAIAALVASSPAALDTLNELAEALGNDPNFATTMTNALANKQPLDNTLTALSGKTVSGLLEYLRLAEMGNTSGKLAIIGNVKTDNDKCAVIVKTGSNANGKYRIWSDGSIDMWGNGIANVNGDALVNYPIALPAAAQNVTTTPLVLSTGTNRPTTSVMLVTDLTTATKATFIVKRSDGSTSADGFYWSVNYAAF